MFDFDTYNCPNKNIAAYRGPNDVPCRSFDRGMWAKRKVGKNTYLGRIKWVRGKSKGIESAEYLFIPIYADYGGWGEFERVDWLDPLKKNVWKCGYTLHWLCEESSTFLIAKYNRGKLLGAFKSEKW